MQQIEAYVHLFCDFSGLEWTHADVAADVALSRHYLGRSDQKNNNVRNVPFPGGKY